MDLIKVEKDGHVEEIHMKRLNYFLSQGWRQAQPGQEKSTKNKLKVVLDEPKKEDNQDDPWVEPLNNA